MNKREFLRILKEALSGTLETKSLNEQLAYYEKYIDDEVRSGRTEQEVLEELGDPRLIAKTIKTVSASDETSENNNSNDNPYNNTYSDNHTNNRSYAGYGQNSQRNKSYGTYINNNTKIGCVIAGLVIFIIIYGIMSFMGRIAYFAFSGPIGFLLVFGIMYLLFGRGR